MSSEQKQCVFLKKAWIETEEDKQELIVTCTNEDCVDFHSEFLDRKNCNEDYCSHFE